MSNLTPGAPISTGVPHPGLLIVKDLNASSRTHQRYFAMKYDVPLVLLISLLTSFYSASSFTTTTHHHQYQLTPRLATSSSSKDNTITSECERNIIILSHNVSQHVADGLFDVNNLLTGRIDVLARCISSALWISNGIRKDTNIFLMLFPHNITIEVRGRDVVELNPDERTTALYLQRALLATGRARDDEIDTCDSLEQGKEQMQQQQRREAELGRLQETNRRRPEVTNPNKPGSLSKSQRRQLRITRKAREAMVRRINRSSGDSPPQGFIIHHDDTLEERLNKLNDGGYTIMLNELGETLGDIFLDSTLQSNNANSNYEKNFKSTTIILGDQIGYATHDEEMLAKNEAVRQVSLGPLSLLTSQCITIVHNFLDTQQEQ